MTDDHMDLEHRRYLSEQRTKRIPGRRPGQPLPKRISSKPRKKSQKQEIRETDVANAMENIHGLKLSAVQRARTATLLKEMYDCDVSAFQGWDTIWTALQSSNNRLMVRKANKRYLRALIYVYALYQWVMSAGDDTHRYLILLCEKAGIRMTPKMDPLRTIARFVISYDPDISLEAAGTKSIKYKPERKDWSRDALAIEWLISRGIPPDKVEAYQAKHGGGADAWSRAKGSASAGLEKKKVAAEAIALKNEREPRKVLDLSSYFNDEDVDADIGEDANGDGDWSTLPQSQKIKDRQQRVNDGRDLTGYGIWESASKGKPKS